MSATTSILPERTAEAPFRRTNAAKPLAINLFSASVNERLLLESAATWRNDRN